MSKFKVGDKVKRLLSSSILEAGGVYTVSGVCLEGWVTLQGKEAHGQFNPKYFALVEDTSNYYKHYDVVIAWMQGREVQYQRNDGGWVNISNSGQRETIPAFVESKCYRLKPEHCPKETKLTSLVSKLEEQLKEAQEQLKEMRNE